MVFRLPLLLYVMAVLAAFLATFGPFGTAGFLLWLPAFLFFRQIRTALARSPLKCLLVAVVLIPLLLTLFLPALQSARESARRMQCRNNLKVIALALHNYHDLHGSFPPAYLADDDGTPMHSWRVLILQCIEEQHLYDQYDFSEPWNGPNNGKLAIAPNWYLRCPSCPALPVGHTNYVVVVGPRTAFPGTRGRSLDEITDGAPDTILVVETVDSVPWMEPRDITFDEACETLRSPSLSSHHPLPPDTFFFVYEGDRSRSANVANADGSIRYLEGPLRATSMAALLTVDGGESTADLEFMTETGGIRRRLNFRRIYPLVVLILLILMPTVWRPWQIREKSQASPIPQ